MKKRNGIRGLWFFLAGAITASVLSLFLFGSQNVLADQYSCIRQDLNARGMSGNIPDPEFTITYEIPSCYTQAGYSVKRVYMYGDEVAVRYTK